MIPAASRGRSALTYTGVVAVPRALPRLVTVASEGTADFIFLPISVAHHGPDVSTATISSPRRRFASPATAISIWQEEEARSLLDLCARSCITGAKATRSVWKIEADADPEIIDRLRTCFELDPWQVFPVMVR